MYNVDAINQFNDFSQAALERLVRMNQISAAVAEKLTKQQLAVVEENVKSGMEQAQNLRDIRDVQELFSMQPKLAIEYAEKFKAQAQEMMNIVLEAQAELTKLAEEGLQSVTAEVEAAAPAAKPRARKAS
ncbi:MAG: phasin family protein [Gammaproteobacteria bacterium]|nr:phasin family protein [Gammaproteobacteria bacterium]